jgi:hypothetical protein
MLFCRMLHVCAVLSVICITSYNYNTEYRGLPRAYGTVPVTYGLRYGQQRRAQCKMFENVYVKAKGAVRGKV